MIELSSRSNHSEFREFNLRRKFVGIKENLSLFLSFLSNNPNINKLCIQYEQWSLEIEEIKNIFV